MLSVGSAVGVSGCAPQEPAPGPTPSPTLSAPPGTAPVLPTNEEALAIVEELVPKFLAAEAAVTAGAAGVESLEPLTTDEHVLAIEQSVDDLNEVGRKSVGEANISNFSVQSIDRSGDEIVIRVYGCYDMTNFDLLDSAGASAKAPDVPDRFTVVFEVIGTGGVYKWNGSEPWSGTSSCS